MFELQGLPLIGIMTELSSTTESPINTFKIQSLSIQILAGDDPSPSSSFTPPIL